MSSSQKTLSHSAKPPKSEVTHRLKPVKARVRCCCERVKVGAVVTETAGVEEFMPKEGGAEEEGWSESNMVAKLLFVERPRIIMTHLQRPVEETCAGKLVVKTRKQSRDSLQGVPTLRRNANTQKNAD